MSVSGPGTNTSKKARGTNEPEEPKDPPNAVKFVVGPFVRADLIGYSGVDVTGGQFIAQLYPSGHRRGWIEGDRLRSIVIGAPIGIRVILCASEDEGGWQESAWRCIRLVEGNTYFTTDGTPAVRVPNIEWLDAFDHKKSTAVQSYPHAAKLADGGNNWTFGRGGTLQNRVRMIRIEHQDRPIPAPK